MRKDFDASARTCLDGNRLSRLLTIGRDRTVCAPTCPTSSSTRLMAQDRIAANHCLSPSL